VAACDVDIAARPNLSCTGQHGGQCGRLPNPAMFPQGGDLPHAHRAINIGTVHRHGEDNYLPDRRKIT